MGNSQTRRKLVWLVALTLWLVIQSSAHALASTLHPKIVPRGLRRMSSQSKGALVTLRGGEQHLRSLSTSEQDSTASTISQSALEQNHLQHVKTHEATLFPVTALVVTLGKAYADSLAKRPIVTKSVTACAIFGISDYLAQRLESKESSSKATEAANQLNWTRLLTSMVVGLCYFGPAAHAWYDMIFKLFPGTGLLSTLQKAAMGQMFFGPSFTCIFFASSLWQAGQFTLGNWFRKIRKDLPGAWLAGVGFWPLVDLVSYSFVPVPYIPLFINMCSLVWTIYLSMIANRSSPAPRSE